MAHWGILEKSTSDEITKGARKEIKRIIQQRFFDDMIRSII
jgi:hypothetical protein